MADLKDYSGPFDPNLKLNDFSKECLEKLIKAACKDYVGIDGAWGSLMNEKVGQRQSFLWGREMWTRWGVYAEVRRTREAFNIRGNDVEAVMKYCQFTASLGALYDVDVVLKDKNHGEYTIRRCQSLEYFERHNDMELLKEGCVERCVPLNQLSAEPFNPKIKWVPIKLPPRKSPNDIACKWAIYLEE